MKKWKTTKSHYLLAQLADILMQRCLACNRLVKEMGQKISMEKR